MKPTKKQSMVSGFLIFLIILGAYVVGFIGWGSPASKSSKDLQFFSNPTDIFVPLNNAFGSAGISPNVWYVAEGGFTGPVNETLVNLPATSAFTIVFSSGQGTCNPGLTSCVITMSSSGTLLEMISITEGASASTGIGYMFNLNVSAPGIFVKKSQQFHIVVQTLEAVQTLRTSNFVTSSLTAVTVNTVSLPLVNIGDSVFVTATIQYKPNLASTNVFFQFNFANDPFTTTSFQDSTSANVTLATVTYLRVAAVGGAPYTINLQTFVSGAGPSVTINKVAFQAQDLNLLVPPFSQ